MWSEDDFDRRAGGRSQNLPDLGRVAMATDVIGRNALVALGVMRSQFSTCAPEPEMPLFESMMIERRSIMSAFNNGASARMAVVG